MAKIQIITLLLTAFMSACADTSSTVSNSNTISFGVYDVSDSGVATAKNAPANTDTTSTQGRGTGSGNGGGGGGGGSESLNQPVVQQISLTEAQQTQESPTAADRKIIRNAELNLEADSPEESQQKIAAIAQSNGGFVVESQQSSSDVKTTTRDTVTMTVRVPADKFADTVAEIRKTASRVIVETVKGEDVTEQFIDIEARLKAKKALELQFLEIMKQAKSVGEALSVQSQLADVRGEIEQIEGRKRFLENQASLSTIKIRLQTPAAFSANSTGFVYRFTESFSAGLDFALNFILGLLTVVIGVLPFALFIGLPGYFIARYFWRRQSRPKSVSEIAQEEIKSE